MKLRLIGLTSFDEAVLRRSAATLGMQIAEDGDLIAVGVPAESDVGVAVTAAGGGGAGPVIAFVENHTEARIAAAVDAGSRGVFASPADEREVTTRLAAWRAQPSTLRLIASGLQGLSAQVALINTEGVIVFVNAAWDRAWTGADRKPPLAGVGANYLEVCERSAQDPVDGDFARRAATGLRQILAGMAPDCVVEYPCHSPSQKRWFRMRASAFLHAKQYHAIVLHEEITDRYLLEDALARERDLFDRIMDTSVAAITVVNTSGRITYVNSAAARVLGVSQEEVLSRTYNSPNWRHEAIDGGPFPDEQMPFARCMRGELVTDVRHAIVSDDGVRKCLSINGAPLRDPDGTINGAVFNVYEITEQLQREREIEQAQQRLHESESFLRRLTDTLPTIVYVYDIEEARTVFINRAVQAVVGYSPDEVIAMGPAWTSIVIDPSDHHRLEPAMRETMAAKGEPVEHEWRLRHRNGHVLSVVSRNVAMIEGSSGKIRRIIGAISDLSRVKDAEEALRQAQVASLEHQKLEALGTLARGVAHDFNNILGPILGFSQLMIAQGGPADPNRERLEAIATSAMRGRDLVAKILAFGKPRQGRTGQVSLPAVAREVLALVRSGLTSTMEVTIDIDETLPEVSGDPTEVHQVLMNLCTNAAHAMEGGSGRLHLVVRRSDASDTGRVRSLKTHRGPCAVVEVHDTGEGIPPDLLPRIFDPFFTTKGKRGTGLGLSTCQAIMHALGGSVSVVSEVGKGSVFSLLFPITVSSRRPAVPEEEPPAAVPRDQTTRVIASTAGVAPTIRTTKRILVVDDEDLVREVMVDALLAHDFDVEDAPNGVDALAKLRADPWRYDLLLTDNAMPRMTGVELSRKVRQLRPELPILVATGFQDTAVTEAVTSGLVDECLAKPVSITDLVAIVGRLLDTRPAG